jgi:hypothetical protein
MCFKPKFDRFCSLVSWALLLYLLVTPPLVGHRHSDLLESDGTHQQLASHLNRYHFCDGAPVDDNQFHVHLAFSILPGELRPDVSCNIGLLLSTEVPFQNQDISSECFSKFFTDESPVLDSRRIGMLSAVRPTHNLANFKRIRLCVWNI